ncbi:hypothetical protein NUACC26_056550 [Scytonema sp. NUACC26]
MRESQGKPISGNDLLIAAHALNLNLTLVTNNVREFSRVPKFKSRKLAEPKLKYHYHIYTVVPLYVPTLVHSIRRTHIQTSSKESYLVFKIH